MMSELLIKEKTGIAFAVKRGATISIINIEGKQVADLFAVNFNDHSEFLSTAVTIDCKESIRITTGDILYSNLYNPMLTILSDTVGTNDVLIPCCRTETYNHFYNNGADHKNCFDNINNSLESFGIPAFNSIQPFNVFMHTMIDSSGKITINPPISEPGDYITLSAEMDLIVCVSACPLTEGHCNGGASKPIKIIIGDGTANC